VSDNAPETVPLHTGPDTQALTATPATVAVPVGGSHPDGDEAATRGSIRPPVSFAAGAVPAAPSVRHRHIGHVELRPLAIGAAVVLVALLALAALVGVFSAREPAPTVAADDQPARAGVPAPPLDRIKALVTSCAGPERAEGLTATPADDKGRWPIEDGLGTRALVDVEAGKIAVIPTTTETSRPAAFTRGKGKGKGGTGGGSSPAPAPAPTTAAPTSAPPATTAPADPYAACAG